jgi:hypothetical protein
MPAGYLVDLAKVKLDESNGVYTSVIQGMTVGKYQHPVFGEIDITPDRIKRFAENVNNHVRGTDLDIDYDHKARSGEAAGWVKSAEARNDGLFLHVEWTEEAAGKIKNKAYRYFSPEFDDEWTHPKSGQKFQDVLFGGGITNRPFLKDIMPINLSEAFASAEQVETDEGGKMDPKKLRELLGLPEDATDEQVTTKLTELKTAQDQNKPGEGGDKKGGAGGASQLSEEVIRLAEQSPAVKALTDLVATQSKQLEEIGTTLRLAEVKNTTTQLSESAAAKKRAYPAAVLEGVQKLLLKVTDKQLSEEIVKTFSDLSDSGFVELGERGSTPDEHSSDSVKQFEAAVKKFQDDNPKASYLDAVNEVARRDPKLFSEYRSESTAFVTA